MPANSKPGIDWDLIRRRIMAGESYRAISKSMTEDGTPITHTGIRYRAIREGWAPTTESKKWSKAFRKTETARALAARETHSDKRLATLGNRNEQNAKLIIARLKAGGSRKLAAATVGFSESGLRKWVDDDPEFGAMLDAAEVETLQDATEQIVRAGRRGDWKASAHHLAHHRLTREDYGDKSQGGGITVVFNFDRDQAAPAIEGEYTEESQS